MADRPESQSHSTSADTNSTGTLFGFDISPEFIEQQKTLNRKPRHKFAPYTRKERNERRKKVFHLHFELGYPATRISEETGIHRNTINSDIQFIYAEMGQKMDRADYLADISKHIIRIELQRTRLLSYLENEQDANRKLKIEQMIIDTDFRIASLLAKIEFGGERFLKAVFKRLNEYAKKQKFEHRFASPFEAFLISVRTRRKWDTLRGELEGKE